MWKLAYLLTWLGIAWGIQPNLEFQYRYSGRLATGITEMRHQFAAVGIEADLTFQFVEFDDFITLKLDNVQVGKFHGDHNCDLRLPIPIDYEPLQEGADILQRPFRQYMDPHYLEVPSDEPSWITNIRKSIVDILPLHTLWEESRNSEPEFARPNFGKEEQLIGGRCMNWYSVTMMPDEEAAEFNQLRELRMEEDVQFEGAPASASYKASKGTTSTGGTKGRSHKGSKSSRQQTPSSSSSSSSSTSSTDVRTVHENLWNVKRTVDYDMCSHLAQVKINSNKEREDLVSRTSVARYVIRGDADAFRLEKAVVEGGISVFTNEDSHDHIDTFTNQTLELRVVRRITNKMEIDYTTRRVYSWQYEVTDTSSTTADTTCDHDRDLEEKLTGIQKRTEDFDGIKNILLSALDQLSSPSGPNNLVTSMDTVVKAVSYLPYEQLDASYKQLIRKFGQEFSERTENMRTAHQNIYNFKVALALAGTESAVKVSLDILEDEAARFEDGFIYFFFHQISTTLKAPSLVPRIFNLAMSLSWNETEDIAKTAALTSSGSLADKFCLNAERRTRNRDSFSNGECVCDADDVISSFLPYLKKGLQDTLAPVWQRVVQMQALINLDTPMSIEILQPIILGIDEDDVGLRTTAISSLSAHVLPQSAMGLVYEMLMPIIQNEGESPDVRSMAFLIMTSWKPGPAWWKHMALSTWHEPSSHVANFISSTIKATADSSGEMAQMVSRIVHLAKPAEWMSFSSSSNVHLNNFLSSNHPEKDFSIIWFANTEGLIPTHISIYYQLQKLHGFSSPSKVGLSQIRLDFFYNIFQQYKDQFAYGDVSTEAHALFHLVNTVTEELGFRFSGFPNDSKMYFKSDDDFLFANNIEFFGGGRIYGFIRDFQRYLPKSLQNINYDKSIDTTVAYPTDLGIPFILQYSEQSAFKLTFWLEKAQNFTGTRSMMRIKFNLQGSEETSVSAETMVPWLKSRVGSGIRRQANVLLPGTIEADGFLASKQIVIRLHPKDQDIVRVVKASNHPYTVLSKGHLASLDMAENDFKEIHRYGAESFSNWGPIAKMSGIWLESSWEGDIESPSLFSMISGDFNLVAPTYSNWDYNVTYEKRASDSKYITFIFTYGSATKKSVAEVDPESESLGQESQGPSDYSDYSQFSQSASQDYSQSGFQEESIKTDPSELKGDLQEALQRLNQLQDEVQSGHMRSISARLSIDGSVKRNLELILTLVNDDSQPKRNTKVKVKLYHDIPQGLIAATYMTCLDVDFVAPNLLPLATAEDVLNTDFTSIIKSQLHAGRSCEGPPIIEAQGNFKVTARQIAVVREKLNGKCDYDPDYPARDIVTSQLYDAGNIDIKWTEDLPYSWRHFVRQYYDMMEGCAAASGTCDYEGFGRPSTFSVRGQKDVYSNRVTAQTMYGEKQCSHKISLPPFLGFPTSTLDAFEHRIMNGRNPVICSLNKQRVHTVDGKNFPFSPNNCWKTVVIEKETVAYLLQVRYADEWEAKVMLRDRGIILELTSTTIKVNGETHSGPHNLFEVIKQGHSMLVILNNGIAVKISDGVQIQMSFQQRTKVSGLCGLFDSEKSFEMLGPKGCVYRDAELYAAAWEVSGDGCNAFSHQGRKRKVEQYQSDCPKKRYIPTGVSHENVQNHCVAWRYKERTEGHCKCKSLVPVPVCNSGCNSNVNKQERITFDCHQDEGHSDQDTDCNLLVFTTSYPLGCKKM